MIVYDCREYYGFIYSYTYNYNIIYIYPLYPTYWLVWTLLSSSWNMFFNAPRGDRKTRCSAEQSPQKRWTHRIHGAGILMLTWLGYIDGIHVTIYTSTMDPMGWWFTIDSPMKNCDFPQVELQGGITWCSSWVAKATCFGISLMASLQWSRQHVTEIPWNHSWNRENSWGHHPHGWISLWHGILELRGCRCSLSAEQHCIAGLHSGGRWKMKRPWVPRMLLFATSCDHKRGLAGLAVEVKYRWISEMTSIYVNIDKIIEHSWNEIKIIKFRSNEDIYRQSIDLRTPRGTPLETVESPRLTRLRDRTPGTDARDAMIHCGSEKANCPNQHQPAKDIQRFPDDFQRCPPTGPLYPSLLLHSCSSFVSLFFFVFDNGLKKISGLGQPELYRVDSRLSCWAERNLLRSSWEISTIGTNITQHRKHTKSYWKSPSLMSKSTISMAIFNSELVCLPCWTNQRPNIGRQSGTTSRFSEAYGSSGQQ